MLATSAWSLSRMRSVGRDAVRPGDKYAKAQAGTVEQASGRNIKHEANSNTYDGPGNRQRAQLLHPTEVRGVQSAQSGKKVAATASSVRVGATVDTTGAAGAGTYASAGVRRLVSDHGVSQTYSQKQDLPQRPSKAHVRTGVQPISAMMTQVEGGSSVGTNAPSAPIANAAAPAEPRDAHTVTAGRNGAVGSSVGGVSQGVAAKSGQLGVSISKRATIIEAPLTPEDEVSLEPGEEEEAPDVLDDEEGGRAPIITLPVRGSGGAGRGN